MPRITKNLLSISKLSIDFPTDDIFSNKFFAIQNRVTKQKLAQGRCHNDLYILDRGISTLVATIQRNSLKASFDLWHVLFPIISLLSKLGQLSVTSDLPNPRICSSC